MRQDIRILDGDTLVFEGELIRLADADAPELGPWARCWAEAALAGHAKNYVESQVTGQPDLGTWALAGATEPDAQGRRRARLVREDGQELTDLLVVAGYAAKSAGRWDWCGADAGLHDPREGEPEPYGPNLWWPTGAMYDPRAAD